MKELLIIPAIFIITYLLGAFVEWDINPAHWGLLSRSVAVITSVFLSVMALDFISKFRNVN